MEAELIWSQYLKGTEYLNRNNLYESVKINENFYDGRQWEGLETKNMPTPVFNILQRCGKYMVASITSKEVAISMTPFSELPDDFAKMRLVSKEIEKIVEQAKIKEDTKTLVRNAFVDGHGYFLQTFNPDVETFQDIKGVVENQLIDNTNVYFGNPYSNRIQTQPWIIVALRQNLAQVKEEAKNLGVSKEEIEMITPDNDSLQANDDSTDLVTVLLRFYRKNKTIHFTKSTHNVFLIKETDLGYKRYPLSCFGWDIKKNSYLYNSPMTSVIPNQVFINKCYAIAMMYGLQSAFPKVVFDKSKVDIEEFMNSSATAVAGIDMMGKFLDFIKIPDFSNNIIQLAQDVIAQTKDCLGVTDASLGNVKPDNTSAIIALQETSSTPLELQKQAFYECWEDTVRNIIDIVSCSYGTRKIMTTEGMAIVDFSMLKDLNYELNVDIGSGAQYSEMAQMTTLNNLMQYAGLPADIAVSAMPQKYIPQKDVVVNALKEQRAMAMEQLTQPQV